MIKWFFDGESCLEVEIDTLRELIYINGESYSYVYDSWDEALNELTEAGFYEI